MKEKNVFEASGNSPTATATVRVSENGAAIQTGRGLEETKRRIMEAFESIRQHPAHPAQHPAGQEEEPPLAQQTRTRSSTRPAFMRVQRGCGLLRYPPPTS